MQLRKLGRLYKEAIEQEDYEAVDIIISRQFWSLKKVQKAFEKLIGTEDRPKRINPNPFDTPTYYLMKPSEQANVEGKFMYEVLMGEHRIEGGAR